MPLVPIIRLGSYIICLAVWIGAALFYPKWTGWVDTRESAGGDANQERANRVWQSVDVSPARAPVWDPPHFFRDPSAARVRWPWHSAPGKGSYIEIGTMSVGFQVTVGVLALAVIYGWSYPFRVRPPDYAAGMALGAAQGLVLAWFVIGVVSLLLFFRDARPTRDQANGSILSAALLLGAAGGVWCAWRIRRRLPDARKGAEFGGFSRSIVQVSWFAGGAMLGILTQFFGVEIAEGLTRYFGWPLHHDPAFGTVTGPAYGIAAFLLWIPMVYVSWIRWRKGPRAFAMGLGFVSLLVLVGLLLS